MKTPSTKEGLQRFDSFSPDFAVHMAWTEPGEFPGWHYEARSLVRKAAPELVGYIEEYGIHRQAAGEVALLCKAVAEAWKPSPTSISRWLMRRRVRSSMPALAHSLDRLTLEQTGIN